MTPKRKKGDAPKFPTSHAKRKSDLTEPQPTPAKKSKTVKTDAPKPEQAVGSRTAIRGLFGIAYPDRAFYMSIPEEDQTGLTTIINNQRRDYGLQEIDWEELWELAAIEQEKKRIAEMNHHSEGDKSKDKSNINELLAAHEADIKESLTPGFDKYTENWDLYEDPKKTSNSSATLADTSKPAFNFGLPMDTILEEAAFHAELTADLVRNYIAKLQVNGGFVKSKDTNKAPAGHGAKQNSISDKPKALSLPGGPSLSTISPGILSKRPRVDSLAHNDLTQHPPPQGQPSSTRVLPLRPTEASIDPFQPNEKIIDITDEDAKQSKSPHEPM